MGCTSIVVSNSNIARIENLGQNIELTENGLKYIKKGRFDITRFKLEKGKTIKVGFKLLTELNSEDNVMISGILNGIDVDELEFNNLKTYELNKTYERTYTATEDCTINFNFSGSSKNNFEFQFWINFDELKEYTRNESELKIVEIQKEMLNDDTFIKEDDGWKEVHNWAKIDSYNGENITAEYISTTGELTTGATVYYKLETPTKLVCTEKQKEQLDDLLNTITYKNLTYVYSVDALIYYRNRVSPIVKITYVKDLEAYINKSQEEQNKSINEKLDKKIDKEEGKGLSTNDFDNAYKKELDGLENYDDTKIKEDIGKKVDKEEGKGLSTNDFDNDYKEKLDKLNNYDDTKIKEDIAKNTENITKNAEKITKNTENITKNTDALTKANNRIAELEATVALQDEQIPRRRRRRRKHYISG